MRRTNRALAVLTLTGTLVVSATPVAGATATPRSCDKTFSFQMFERAVHRVYHSRALPPRGSYGHLWRYARCQRPPSSETRARSAWARALSAWASLRRPPVIKTEIRLSPITPLVRCILWNESTSTPDHLNATAVSPGGTYKGIGQWQDSTWIADGGGRYGPTALNATGPEQLSILIGEGQAGQEQQQGQYDHCG